MRRMRYRVAAGLVMGTLLLGGCKETPENVIVKQKGEQAVANYEEEDKETADSSKSESTTSGEGYVEALREKLNVPKHYQDAMTSADGRVEVVTDADIELPDTPKLSAVHVTAVPLTQEWLEKISYGLFPEGKFYDEEAFAKMTKSQIEEKIGELKGYISQGNLDPYNLGKDEDGNLNYDIYENLEWYEEEYQNAPDAIEKIEIKPEIDESFNDNPSFSAQVEDKNGASYGYSVRSGAGNSILVKAKRYRSSDNNHGYLMWQGYDRESSGKSSDGSSDYDSSWKPSREEIENSVGISWEDAKRQADDIVASMGITDMDLEEWEYALQSEISSEPGVKVERTGYYFYYTRKIENCPITYTSAFGGSLEEHDSPIEPWCYERLDIVISKDGLEDLYYSDPYQIGETEADQVKLLDFSQIIDILHQMIEYKYSNYMGEEDKWKFNIDRITLGYSRIYNPGDDSRSGILVPVWDFFGGRERVSVEGDITYETKETDPYQSHITINAIDGTIIDREFGY